MAACPLSPLLTAQFGQHQPAAAAAPSKEPLGNKSGACFCRQVVQIPPVLQPPAGQLRCKGPRPSPGLRISTERALVPAGWQPLDTGVQERRCPRSRGSAGALPLPQAPQPGRAGRAAPLAAPAAPGLFVFAGPEAKARLTKGVHTRALMPGLLCCRCGRSHATTGTAPGCFTSTARVAMAKAEFCLNPAGKAAGKYLAWLLPGQEGPCSVLCWALLPAAVARHLWGWAGLGRSLGAQHVCAPSAGSIPPFFFFFFLNIWCRLSVSFTPEESGGLACRLPRLKKTPCAGRGEAAT